MQHGCNLEAAGICRTLSVLQWLRHARWHPPKSVDARLPHARPRILTARPVHSTSALLVCW